MKSPNQKPPKRENARESKLLDIVMPDGKLLRNCSSAEIDAMKRFEANQATIGELDAAGPSTASFAFQLTREIILAQSLKPTIARRSPAKTTKPKPDPSRMIKAAKAVIRVHNDS